MGPGDHGYRYDSHIPITRLLGAGLFSGHTIRNISSAIIFVPALVARIIIKESPFMAKLLEQKLTVSAPSILVFKRYWLPIILLAMWS